MGAGGGRRPSLTAGDGFEGVGLAPHVHDAVDGPAGVTIGQLAGCTATFSAGPLVGDATFEVVGQDVVAVVKVGTVGVEPDGWGRIKALYR